MLRKGDVTDRIYPDERSSLMRGDGGWEKASTERRKRQTTKEAEKTKKKNFIETFVPPFSI